MKLPLTPLLIFFFSVLRSSQVFSAQATPTTEAEGENWKLTLAQLEHELGPGQQYIDQSKSNQLLTPADLTFVITKIEDSNRHLFQTFYKQEKELAASLQLLTYYNFHMIDQALPTPTLKLVAYLKQHRKFFLQVEEPIIHVQDTLAKEKLPPTGLFVASFLDNNNQDADKKPSPVISMLVIPSLNSSFQLHQFISRSVQYQLRSFFGNRPPPKFLSIALHQKARQFLGATYYTTRPLPFMGKLLRQHGCVVLKETEDPDTSPVATFLGKACYQYERKFGITGCYLDFYYGT